MFHYYYYNYNFSVSVLTAGTSSGRRSIRRVHATSSRRQWKVPLINTPSYFTQQRLPPPSKPKEALKNDDQAIFDCLQNYYNVHHLFRRFVMFEEQLRQRHPECLRPHQNGVSLNILLHIHDAFTKTKSSMEMIRDAIVRKTFNLLF